MAKNLIEIKKFRGLNILDSDSVVGEKGQARKALNVDVNREFIEVTPGYSLYNQDTGKTGGIKYMFPYYKSDGTKQLIFANDDDWYYLDISSAIAIDDTWQTIGNYGTATNNPAGIIYDDQVILGGGGTNELKKWDGTTLSAVSNQPTSNNGINIFEIISGLDFETLLGAKEGTSKLYWCVPGDPDDWDGGGGGSNYGNVFIGKNDGEGIYGLRSHGNKTWIIKDHRKYPMKIRYDQESNTYLPRIFEQTDSSGGSVAQHTVQAVTSGVADDIRMLSGNKHDGISSFGRPANFNDSLVSFSQSEVVNPLLNLINWEYVSLSRAIHWNRKYQCAVPWGSSNTNNVVFVEHLETGAFTVYDHINVGCWAKVKDENGFEQLLVGDALKPKIYKFDSNRYDVNNESYRRVYKTGKIYFDRETSIKSNLKWIDIAGAIKESTSIIVSIFLDDIEKNYEINSDQLRTVSDGSLIGDKIIGNNFVGGTTSSNDKFRFIAYIDISNIQRDFRSVEIQFENSEVGEYWKIDYLAFDFEDQRNEIPRNSQYILIPN